MNPIELAALIIIIVSVASLVFLTVRADIEDRRPLDPPVPEVPPPAYRPRHGDWTPTTLLRKPPPREPEN